MQPPITELIFVVSAMVLIKSLAAVETIISKLSKDKIKINWNKRPIAMSLFKSLLTVELTKSTGHLGESTGWTKWVNEEKKLIVGGGIVNGIDLLDSLEYGRRLDNPYNNYVNPFYLFDIMTEEGKRFFLDYYKQEIALVMAEQESEAVRLERMAENKRQMINAFKSEL